MSENVVDARGRFGTTRRRAFDLSAMRADKRLQPADRVVLAKNLGLLSAEMNPAKPEEAAKKWFDAAWSGDRWEKRKRYICFPHETSADPFLPGTYVASSADWLKLLEVAAAACAPTEEREGVAYARLLKRLVRGTSYLPAAVMAPNNDDVRKLLQHLCSKATEIISERTEVERLWECLKTTPFAPIVDLEISAALTEVEEASWGAQKIPEIGPHHRFKVIDRLEEWRYVLHWMYPGLLLGILGRRYEALMFALPHDFQAQLPDAGDEAATPADDAFAWLAEQGIISNSAEVTSLPDIPFDEARGYGWQTFDYEVYGEVYLRVEPKDDGSAGLGVEIIWNDDAVIYPLLKNFDALASDAHDGAAGGRGLSVHPTVNTHALYEFIQWPTHPCELTPGGTPTDGAVTGVFRAEGLDFEVVEGWLDDVENGELQAALLRNDPNVRFCPSITVNEDAEVPCSPGTIAASLFANLAAPSEEQVVNILIARCETIAKSGLLYYDALVQHNRALINRL